MSKALHYDIPIYAVTDNREKVLALRNVYKDSKCYYITYKNRKTYVVKHHTRFLSFKLTREAILIDLYGI